MPLNQDIDSSTSGQEETNRDAVMIGPTRTLDESEDGQPGVSTAGSRSRPETSPPNTERSSEPSGSAVDLEALLRSRELEHARELAERETKAAAWEQRYKQAIRERELATALAGKPLVPGAASQLVQLWSGEFDVYEENGTTRVTTRDGRSVSRAIADWLSSPEYAHFCQSPSRGGTSPPGANRSAPAIATASRPKTLGDAAIQRWREAATGHGAETSTPIGLHRRR